MFPLLFPWSCRGSGAGRRAARSAVPPPREGSSPARPRRCLTAPSSGSGWGGESGVLLCSCNSFCKRVAGGTRALPRLVGNRKRGSGLYACRVYSLSPRLSCGAARCRPCSPGASSVRVLPAQAAAEGLVFSEPHHF